MKSVCVFVLRLYVYSFINSIPLQPAYMYVVFMFVVML